jgi:two-component system sensor histidine kinase/response regulator
MIPNLHILVVESDPVQQESVAGILTRLEHSFDIASGWRRSLDLLNRGPYDLILMSCRLPEMDGYQLTRLIRELHPGKQRIPIVAMTLNAPEEREKCLIAGMDEVVAKPTLPARLEAAIAETIGRFAAPTGFDEVDLIERMMGNENLARRVAGRFLEDMPRQLMALSQALGAADAESARRIAHSIKGAAANISVTHVHDLAGRLEDLGSEGRLDDASQLLPQLTSTFDSVIPVMRRFCGK